MSGWVDIGAGILFCITGVYLFQKKLFDKDGELWKPLVLLALGVILITTGTARTYGLK